MPWMWHEQFTPLYKEASELAPRLLVNSSIEILVPWLDWLKDGMHARYNERIDVQPPVFPPIKAGRSSKYLIAIKGLWRVELQNFSTLILLFPWKFSSRDLFRMMTSLNGFCILPNIVIDPIHFQCSRRLRITYAFTPSKTGEEAKNLKIMI